jgi:hypothetical protein
MQPAPSSTREPRAPPAGRCASDLAVVCYQAFSGSSRPLSASACCCSPVGVVVQRKDAFNAVWEGDARRPEPHVAPRDLRVGRPLEHHGEEQRDRALPTGSGAADVARRLPPLDRYQMLKRGSPVFEMASAIQALALALSAIRSARDGALSLSPPALMYCCAILPSDRQFSELSYFTPRSWTSEPRCSVERQ